MRKLIVAARRHGLTALGRAVSFVFYALEGHMTSDQTMVHSGTCFTITLKDGIQFDVEIKNIKRKV